MNRWKIPCWLEQEVTQRDRVCIYCGVSFEVDAQARGSRRSWEHIVNDASIINSENIALCCIGCNASKGTKSLSAWLGSKYCASRGIKASTLAPVALAALERGS